ncbi:MAG: TetR/AcrR family transcriptional regulator [Pirellulales bacterium]
MARPSARTRSAGDMEAHLLDCALTVFAERGYDATVVRDILRVAGVTQPTLYYYFPSKQELFLRLVRRHGSEALELLRQALQEITGCESRLRVIMQASFAACAGDPRIPRLMFQTTFGPRLPGISEVLDELAERRFALVRDVIGQGVDRGELAASSVDGLALAFCCLMDQHLNVLARQPQPERYLTPELAHWLVTLFLRGAARIAPPDGVVVTDPRPAPAPAAPG